MIAATVLTLVSAVALLGCSSGSSGLPDSLTGKWEEVDNKNGTVIITTSDMTFPDVVSNSAPPNCPYGYTVSGVSRDGLTGTVELDAADREKCGWFGSGSWTVTVDGDRMTWLGTDEDAAENEYIRQ